MAKKTTDTKVEATEPKEEVVVADPKGSAEVAVVDKEQLERMKQEAFGSSTTKRSGGGKESGYKKFFVEREESIKKLISGELNELDVTDIVALGSRKTWSGSYKFNRHGFISKGGASHVAAAAEVCRGLLPEDDENNYTVRLSKSGMLTVSKN